MDNTVELSRLSTTNVPVAQAGGPAVTRRSHASADIDDDQKLCISFLEQMLGLLPRGCESKQDQCCSISESTALGDTSVVPHERPESASNVPFAEQPQPSPCDQAGVFSPPSRTPPGSYTNERGQVQCLSSESTYPNSRQPPRFARKTQPRFSRKKTSNSNNPKDRYRAEKSYTRRERSRNKSTVAGGNVMNISSIVTKVPCFEMEVDGGDSAMVEEVPNWGEGMRSLPLALRRERRVGRKPDELLRPTRSSRLVNREKDRTPLTQNSSTSAQCVEPPTAGHTSTPGERSIDHENTPRPTLVQRTGKSASSGKKRATKSYKKRATTGKPRGPYSQREKRKWDLENDPRVLAYSRIHVRCLAAGVAIKMDSRAKGKGFDPSLVMKHLLGGCHAQKNKEALDKDEHLVKEKTNPYSVECAQCGKTIDLHSKKKRKELKVIVAEVNRMRKEAQEKVTQEQRDSYWLKEEAPCLEEEMNYNAS